MVRFWMCGLVWSVPVSIPLSSNGLTRAMSTSPTGSQTSRSSPLRIPAVCSTLERCVLACVYVVHYTWWVSHIPCVFFWHVNLSLAVVTRRFPCGGTITFFLLLLQTHGWKIGNCTQKLPFMCQRKGEVNESAQSGCPLVSSPYIKCCSNKKPVFVAFSSIVIKVCNNGLTSVHFSGLEKTRQLLLST